MSNLSPGLQTLCWFFSLFLSPPPAETAVLELPAIALAIPGDALAAVSMDMTTLRRQFAALEAEARPMLPRLREILAQPEGQDALGAPGQLDLAWLDDPMDFIQRWRLAAEEAIGDMLGVEPDRLRRYADEIQRIHGVWHGASGMTGVGIAIIVEGPEAAESMAVIGRIMDRQVASGALVKTRGLILDGHDWLVIGLADQTAGLVAVTGMGRRTILATSLPLARNLLRRLDADTPYAAHSLESRLDDWALDGPDGRGGNRPCFWGYVNLPFWLSWMEAIDLGIWAQTRQAIPVGAAVDMMLDLSSMGPATFSILGDGRGVARMGLETISDWRRWLEAGDYRHEIARLDPESVVAAESYGVADGRALLGDWLDRAGALSALLPEGGDGAILAAFLEELGANLEKAAVFLGEPVDELLGRVREAGYVLFEAPDDLGSPLPPMPMALFTLSRSLALSLRLDGPESLDALWSAVRVVLTLAGASPALPEAFPEAGENGWREWVWTRPAWPVPGMGIHALSAGDRVVLAAFRDTASQALEAALSLAPPREGQDNGRGFLNAPALARALRTMVSQSDAPPAAARLLSALELLMSGLPLNRWRCGIDVVGWYAETDGGAIWLSAGAGLAAVFARGIIETWEARRAASSIDDLE